MSILTIIQSGIQSLSGVYAQAASGIEQFFYDTQKMEAARQKQMLMKRLELKLEDLSENGTFYNRVNCEFDCAGSIEENNFCVSIRASYSRPRRDDPKKFVEGCSKTFSIDCASWKTLTRDLKDFESQYTELYAQAYPEDIETKRWKLNKIFSPFLKRAEENVKAEFIICHAREPL